MNSERPPIESILGCLKRVKKLNGSKWTACCPAHDDHDPSLSISEGDDGRVLLRCHAGCSTESIVEAMGLSTRDLFVKSNGHNSIMASPVKSKRLANKTTDYEYKDAAGKLQAVHKRIDHPDGNKDIYWCSADGKLGLNGTPESDLPLYRLPELVRSAPSEPVLFCEGEKAVDAARAYGFTAVSLCGGASQTDFGDALQALRERTVVLWPDNDDAGRALMRRVGARLVGIASEIRWLEPAGSGVSPKDDAADYFAKGGTPDKLRVMLEYAPAYNPNGYEANATSAAQQTGYDQPDKSDLPAQLPPQGIIQESDGWPEPPGHAAFSGLAGVVVRAMEPYTEADPVALLVNFLAALGSAIGRGPHTVTGATRHDPRIFAALVGKTGRGRKGESWSMVRAILARADTQWASNHIHSGISSGEGIIWAVRDPVEKLESRKTKDQPTTYERVIADEGVDDKRLFVLEPELSRVLQVMNRQGNIANSVIRQAWDGDKLESMTKSPVAATDPYIAIVGHITMEELRAELSDLNAANGFANRFHFVVVRRSKLLPDPEPFDGPIVDDLASQVAERIEWARTVGRMERDADAKALWEHVYPLLTEERVGLVWAILGRAEAQVLRLSMLYALLDKSEVIRLPHLQSALELWGYAERSAIHIFGDATGDPIADAIYRALKQRGRLTRTEISSLFKHNVEAVRLSHALNLLLDRGKATTFTEETGGRPVEVWEVKGQTA